MGSSRRFKVTAEFVNRNFSKANKIADVAGGHGKLNIELIKLGYSSVITFDPKAPKNGIYGIEFRRKLFNHLVEDDFDLLVGLHPDGATDHIIVEAGKRRIPFVVIPCCVIPSAVSYKSGYTDRAWQEHLIRLAQDHNFQVETFDLKFSGCNRAITGKPK